MIGKLLTISRLAEAHVGISNCFFCGKNVDLFRSLNIQKVRRKFITVYQRKVYRLVCDCIYSVGQG